MTPDAIRAALDRAAGVDRVRGRGDGDLAPLPARHAVLRPAAVLVPLVGHPDGTTVLMTRRTAHLKAHAGQVAFPGGRADPEDADAAATALREAQEEVGLDPARVRLLGSLDRYETATGFEVTPVVGWIEPPLALRPNPFEVDAVFEVPLAFLLAPDSLEVHSRAFAGIDRTYHVFPYGEHYIWGATAGMLVNLREVLTAPAGG